MGTPGMLKLSRRQVASWSGPWNVSLVVVVTAARTGPVALRTARTTSTASAAWDARRAWSPGELRESGREQSDIGRRNTCAVGLRDGSSLGVLRLAGTRIVPGDRCTGRREDTSKRPGCLKVMAPR